MALFEIRIDDLSSDPVRELLKIHLSGMHESSPPGHVHALDLAGLRAPNVTVWSAWAGTALAGIAALKVHDAATGELKSMRTHPAQLRQGVGSALLAHVVREARRRGLDRLGLETGRGPAFEPALALYRRYGFVDGDVFGDHRPSDFSRFLHLDLRHLST